jgi:hypothetical protein
MGNSLSFPHTQSNSLGHKKMVLFQTGKLNMPFVQSTKDASAPAAKAYTSFSINWSTLRINPKIILSILVLT